MEGDDRQDEIAAEQRSWQAGTGGGADDATSGHAAAEHFFTALVDGDAAALAAVCAPGSTLWNNLTAQDRSLEASIPALAALRAKVPDLGLEAVRRRGVTGGFVEQHVLTGTTPDGEPIRVVGRMIGTVAGGRITRLEEYIDGAQAAALSAVLRSGLP
jgi:ketosteroid isomerase-like protein